MMEHNITQSNMPEIKRDNLNQFIIETSRYYPASPLVIGIDVNCLPVLAPLIPNTDNLRPKILMVNLGEKDKVEKNIEEGVRNLFWMTFYSVNIRNLKGNLWPENKIKRKLTFNDIGFVSITANRINVSAVKGNRVEIEKKEINPATNIMNKLVEIHQKNNWYASVCWVNLTNIGNIREFFTNLDEKRLNLRCLPIVLINSQHLSNLPDNLSFKLLEPNPNNPEIMTTHSGKRKISFYTFFKTY